MAYNATYDEGDIAESVVNTIVKALITLGTLITVIVVVGLWVWIRRRL
jgi:hypothetical protein